MSLLDVEVTPEIVAAIEELGVVASYERTGGVYDPTTGQTSSVPPVVSTIKCSPPAPVSSRLVDGTTVQVDDAASVIAGGVLANEPKIGDFIVINGVRYSVVLVLTVRGDSPVAHELILRR